MRKTQTKRGMQQAVSKTCPFAEGDRVQFTNTGYTAYMDTYHDHVPPQSKNRAPVLGDAYTVQFVLEERAYRNVALFEFTFMVDSSWLKHVTVVSGPEVAPEELDAMMERYNVKPTE